MTALIQKIEGKKTYILMGIGVLYAICGLVLHKVNGQQAFEMIWAALSGTAIRKAIN